MSLLKKIKKKWWFKLLFRPDIYVKGLLISSIGVGLITGILYLMFKYYGGDTGHETIPPAFHSILALVLGLLLVFRTNTAYERWWKGREYFSHIETNYVYIKSKLECAAIGSDKSNKIIHYMITSLNVLESFLKSNSAHDKQKFLETVNLLHLQNKLHTLDVDSSLKDVLDNFIALERIRDTPIPQSYSLHIKFSIFLYFLTLPFGVLYATGYWSILFVMILYYVIAGIEIISNEIENPFHGDPNDLPVKRFIDNIKEQIK